jgi:hypothetical protein
LLDRLTHPVECLTRQVCPVEPSNPFVRT